MGTIYNNIPSNAPTDNVYLNSLIIGGSWTPSIGTRANLTWSTSAGKIYQDVNAYGSAWLLYETNALKTALQTWSNVANVQFNQVNGIYNSDLRYFNVSAGEMLKLAGDSTTLGLHEVPDGSTQTPLYGMFNKQGIGWSLPGLKQGGFGFLTLIHEIGHGLGLAHPHDGNTIFPGVTSAFGSLGDNNLNQGIWTVMSYNDGWVEVPTPTPALSYGQAGTPMAFDIATIQYIYGANTTYKTGNDTYLLPTSNVSGTYWNCIWDAGGIDTISAAASRVSAEINLNAAPLIGPNAAGFVSHVGKAINGSAIVGGFTIANNVVIENATGGSADDILVGNQANNLLLGNAGNDTIYGNAGNDTLDGGMGVDTLVGGTGDDIYLVDIRAVGISPNISAELQDVITENAGEGTADTLRLRGSVLIPAATTAIEIALVGALANIENLDISATGTTKLNLTGNNENNILTGNAAINILNGGFGNDKLDGGVGADTMNGGDGDDTYFVDVIRPTTGTGGDVITDSDGTDTVKTTFSATLTSDQFFGIENLTLLGTAALNATGNGEANELIGNDGANVIDGGAGADDMDGGKGNDTYIVENDGDEVSELFTAAQGGGVDLVKSSVSYSLDTNIENLTMTGTDNISVNGNELNNILTGNIGNNTFDARGGGIDTLIGGKGNDIYNTRLMQIGTGATAKVSLEDDIIELAGANEGYDIIELEGNFDLVNACNIKLGANIEALYAGTTLATKLNFTGNSLDNVIYANEADNIIDGESGIDILGGNGGNDTYLIDLTTLGSGATAYAIMQDGITDSSGTDTIKLRGNANTIGISGLDLIGGYIDIENLDASATGTTRLNLTGNDANNILIGNAAANTLTGGDGDDILNGGAGLDTLVGGIGNDTYVVDSLAEANAIIDGDGNNTLNIGLAYTLTNTSPFTNISLSGVGAVSATGNDNGNELTGNAAANVLNGGAGADSMNGGDGNDTYIVDHAGDTITETNAVLATGGSDLVISSISFDLNTTINIENLTLTGIDDDLFAYGNSLVNVITGNSGRNILYGYGGKDTLIGGAGNDGYQVDLKITGTEGTSAASVSLEDIIIETTALSGGYDAIQLFGNFNLTKASTITLAAGLEALDAQFTNTTLINLVGNAADNGIQGNDADNNIDGGLGNDILIGKSGNDILDGGGGADILDGGSGNDTYLVDIISTRTTLVPIVITGAALQDSISESNDIADGIDTLKLRGSVVIPSATAATEIALTGGLANIENLDISLTGTSKLNITGNAENNFLTGNAANNILTGGDGMDILFGGAGADTMIGGLGIDTYVVDNIADVVTEQADEGSHDMINSFISFDLNTKGANVEYLQLVGQATIGKGNDLNNGIFGNSLANILSGGAGDDEINGGLGNDSLDGGTDDDTLIGGAGNDILNSGADNDMLIGGSGNDTLTGGDGADTFVWNLADKGTNGRPAIDRITDFNIGEPNIVVDKLDLRDLLEGESSANILNFLDVTTRNSAGVTNTEIRISNTGGFASGTFAASAENQHITLAGVNLLTGTNETDLLATLIAQNKLIIDV